MAPSNTLPIYGNEKTMNLNQMILTNIQSSPYFKVNLFELKTYHEVVDEIYYKVNHLEPWEKGSRKTAGQTGMCGGVRGVGAGGIVSSAYCLLYKLYTLKLTRKQLVGLLTHSDSPYIRALGFMYIRYTQPPADLYDWYEEYMDDEEELDVKAGGGHTVTIGEMVRQFMVKLEWYSTLFPRIPVPVQKQMEIKLREYENKKREERLAEKEFNAENYAFGEAERVANLRADGSGSPLRPGGSSHRSSPAFEVSRDRDRKRKSRSRSRERRRRSKSKEHRRSRSHERRRHRSRSRERRRRSRSRSPKRSHKHSRRSRSRERSSRHGYEKETKHGRDRESSFERDLKRERDRVEKQKHEKHSSSYH